MEQDDGQRSTISVAISIVRRDTKLRLVVDDIERTNDSGTTWRKRCLFTMMDVDREEAMHYRLDREVYAAIGDTLLARLIALYSLETGDEVSLDLE